MEQKPPVPFLSNENFEKMIRSHCANEFELERDRERTRYALELDSAGYCQRHGVEPMEDIEETFQAVLKADDFYQRSLYRVGRIQAFMDSLSPEEEEFVNMRFIRGQHWADLAEAFHVSESTLKSGWRKKLLDRAKKMMIEPLLKKRGAMSPSLAPPETAIILLLGQNSPVLLSTFPNHRPGCAMPDNFLIDRVGQRSHKYIPLSEILHQSSGN